MLLSCANFARKKALRFRSETEEISFRRRRCKKSLAAEMRRRNAVAICGSGGECPLKWNNHLVDLPSLSSSIRHSSMRASSSIWFSLFSSSFF
jgi:hypothetical protein